VIFAKRSRFKAKPFQSKAISMDARQIIAKFPIPIHQALPQGK